MPDLLLFNKYPETLFQLEPFLQSKGFRVKSTSEFRLLEEWTKLRTFDAVLVEAQLGLAQAERAGRALWSKDPMASLFIYDLKGEHLFDKLQVQLIGGELIEGQHALAEMEIYLMKIKPIRVSNGEPLSILVVEDLDSPRDIIIALIERLGFLRVQGVGSAGEALSLLRADPKHFSCIVTDVRMPKVSGDELIREVRKDGNLKHLPIIVLTAHGTFDCLVDCLKAGASGFLVKPPKREDLLRELGRAGRIFNGNLAPNLISEQDAELVREMLEKRGDLI